jgi:hypothetical protein
MKIDQFNPFLFMDLLLVVPVISSMSLAACSGVARTVEEHATTTYRVATYIAQSKETSDSRHSESDPEPTFEWFY